MQVGTMSNQYLVMITCYTKLPFGTTEGLVVVISLGSLRIEANFEYVTMVQQVFHSA